MRDGYFRSVVSAVILASCVGAYAQKNVEDVFKEDTSSRGAQVTWTHNPSRVDRTVVVSFEAAWNGLAGLGPIVHYYPSPHLALEAGAGLAGTGLKTGLRGRVVFGKNTSSGFVGLGFSSGSGTGTSAVTLTTDNNTISFQMKRTNFLQFLTGVDVVTKRGFFFLGSIGWAQCMNRDNIIMVSGTPTDIQNKTFDLAYRGGLILGLDFGYAIKVR